MMGQKIKFLCQYRNFFLLGQNMPSKLEGKIHSVYKQLVLSMLSCLRLIINLKFDLHTKHRGTDKLHGAQLAIPQKKLHYHAHIFLELMGALLKLSNHLNL